jgi:hypothetical protein
MKESGSNAHDYQKEPDYAYTRGHVVAVRAKQADHDGRDDEVRSG